MNSVNRVSLRKLDCSIGKEEQFHEKRYFVPTTIRDILQCVCLICVSQEVRVNFSLLFLFPFAFRDILVNNINCHSI